MDESGRSDKNSAKKSSEGDKKVETAASQITKLQDKLDTIGKTFGSIEEHINKTAEEWLSSDTIDWII